MTYWVGNRKIGTLLILFIGFFFSCGSYHSKSLVYQSQVAKGDIVKASESIESNKFLKKDRNLLLYYLEKGKIAFLEGNYVESNELLNKADILIEDSYKKLGDELVGVVTNQENTIYRAEDFEKVAIHYYKAQNYLFLKQYDEALVEAKRINIRLQALNDKYPSGKKNRYSSDAFALNLQGIIYEATGDVNGAFISYRNAVDLYLKAEGMYFGVTIPEQLKQDLLRTASFLGFENEFFRYSELLKTKYIPSDKKNGEAIVFWETGMIPYKDQNIYTCTILPGRSGFVSVVNKDLGLNLLLPIGLFGGSGKTDLSGLQVVKVAFPKYVDRHPYYTSGEIVLNSGREYSLSLAEDYSEIAFKTLKDRTLREIGDMVVRLAVKKTAEHTVRNQNETLGMLLGLVNAATERADTRNWQTLPSAIYYARIPLEEGRNTINVKLKGVHGNTSQEFSVKSKKGIQFLNYSTLGSVETRINKSKK